MRCLFLLRVTVAAALACGCQGQWLEPPGQKEPDPPQLPDRPSPDKPPTALAASGTRRLTRAEYGASVRALLGAGAPVHPELLPLDASSPFDNDASAQVPSLAFVEATEAHADELARWVVADPARRNAVVGCTPAGADDAACFASFVNRFGRRAFRRPLEATERDAFLSFLNVSREDNDFYAGIRYALTAFLSHPAFLYRVEPTAQAESGRALNDYELATRMAYFLTGAGPDELLLDQAAAGFSEDPELIRDAALRLLETPAARAHMARYHAMWLGYGALATEGLFGAMRRESDALVERVVFGKNDYAQLFTSRETWLDAQLASHYGVAAPSTASGAWVTPEDPRRAGILSHASVLAGSSNTDDTSPTRRGKFIRVRLLCDTVPPPPPDVDVDQPPSGNSPDACKEQRYADHRNRPQCAGCHSMMDPIGFGLENFDRLGRIRSHDDGRPQCTIAGRGSLNGVTEFSGPAELGQVLVASGKLEACVTQHLLRFALGRELNPSNARDAAMVATLEKRFRDSGRLMHELLLDITTSQAFRTRLDPEAP